MAGHPPLRAAGSGRLRCRRSRSVSADLRRRRPFIDHVAADAGALRRGEGGPAGRCGHLLRASCRSSRSWRWRSSPSAGSREVYAGGARPTSRRRSTGSPGADRRCPGQIQISSIEDSVATLGIVGLLASLIYSGLGLALGASRPRWWWSSRCRGRTAPNFVFGKLRDLMTLVLIGVILLVSVGVVRTGRRLLRARCSTGCTSASTSRWLIKLLTVVLGFGANMLLFFALFQLLAEPATPRRSLWSGALLGALAFEVLKQISGSLRLDQGRQPGLPGVRDRADPADLDQLLLPGRPLLRRLGAHLAPPPARPARSRSRHPWPVRPHRRSRPAAGASRSHRPGRRRTPLVPSRCSA